MAKWIRFTADYDHRWPSRAMTAFKAGMISFVKDEVAEPALAKKKAVETEKPEPGDPNHVTTASPMESPPDEAYAGADATPPKAPDDAGTDGVAEPDDADDVGSGIRASDKPAA
jgi:hypothetical protein